MSKATRAFALLLVALPLAVLAYVPAIPSNITTLTSGINFTDKSVLFLQWYNNGSWRTPIQSLLDNGPSGTDKGVLVYFSEDNVTDLTPPSTAPWIAYIACDKNSTKASNTEDALTLAHAKGAVSALLYSSFSATCILNPNCCDTPMNVYSLETSLAEGVIEQQFGPTPFLPSNAVISEYDSAALNNSLDNITKSIEAGAPLSAGYLFATLEVANTTNSTGSLQPSNLTNSTISGGNSGSSGSNTGTSSPSTGFALGGDSGLGLISLTCCLAFLLQFLPS